jgi:hypothetical protein
MYFWKIFIQCAVMIFVMVGVGQILASLSKKNNGNK